MKTYVRTPKPVKAVQFFKDNPPKKLVQKAWAEEWGDFYVLDKKHRKPGVKYKEVWVIRGGSPFLKDGDWLILGALVSIMSDERFKSEYQEKP